MIERGGTDGVDGVEIVGDRLVIQVDGLAESTSKMINTLVRAGTLCRTRGIRKVLYLRRGAMVDTVVVTQVVKSLADFGFRGCSVAALMDDPQTAYQWLFLEQLASHDDIRLQICATRADAEAFLGAADPIIPERFDPIALRA